MLILPQVSVLGLVAELFSHSVGDCGPITLAAVCVSQCWPIGRHVFLLMVAH